MSKKKLEETLYCAVRIGSGGGGEFFDLDTISPFKQEVKYRAKLKLDSPRGRVCRIVSINVTEEETIE